MTYFKDFLKGQTEIQNGTVISVSRLGGILREQNNRGFNISVKSMKYDYMEIEANNVTSIKLNAYVGDSVSVKINNDISFVLKPDYYEGSINKTFIKKLEDLETVRDFNGDLWEDTLPVFKLYKDTIFKGEDFLIDEICKAMPALDYICRTPRIELKNSEEIKSLDSVRRTGLNALKYLARHSETWENRIFGRIYPKKLLSLSVEDEWHTYSNRFVKTLIDRLVQHMKGVRDEFQVAENREMDNDCFLGNQSDGLRSKIRASIFERYNNGQDNNGNMINFKRKIEYIDSALRRAKESKFYLIMERCVPVADPLKSSNVLKMDRNYSKLVELWNKLNNRHIPNIENQKKIRYSPQESYEIFASFLVIEALKKCGFERESGFNGVENLNGRCQEKRGGHQIWICDYSTYNDDGLFKIKLSFSLRRKSFPVNEVVLNDLRRINMGNNTLIDILRENGFQVNNRELVSEEYNIDFDNLINIFRPCNIQNNHDGLYNRNPQHKEFFNNWIEMVNEWRQAAETSSSINFIPILADFENGITSDQLSNVLQEVSDFENNENNGIKNVFLVPTEIRLLPENLNRSAVRLLCNYGDNAYAENFDAWRNKSMLPVSRYQFESLLRIVKTISRVILSRNIMDNPRICPICSGQARVLNGNEYVCDACGINYFIAVCGICGNRYPLIKPSNVNNADNNFKDKPYAEIISKQEMMSYSRLIASRCECLNCSEYRWICPACGTCNSNHNGEDGHTCYRCQQR